MLVKCVFRCENGGLIRYSNKRNHTGAAMERMEVLRLYDHHSDEVYRLAYSYLMNRHDAQDIVQEVFLRLLEKIIL